MSVRIMTKIWDMGGLSPVEKLSLLALADWANDDGLAWPSIKQIADKTGCARRTVQMAFAKAEKLGILKREQVVGKGCKYIIDPRTTCTPAPDAPAHDDAQTRAPHAPNTPANIKKKRVTKVTPKVSLKPTGLPDQIWNDWRAVRKRPVTETVLARIQSEADKLGWTLVQAITEAAGNGWQGFNAGWVEQNGGNNRNGNVTESAVAGARARMASLKGGGGSSDGRSGMDRIGEVPNALRAIGHVSR